MNNNRAPGENNDNVVIIDLVDSDSSTCNEVSLSTARLSTDSTLSEEEVMAVTTGQGKCSSESLANSSPTATEEEHHSTPSTRESTEESMNTANTAEYRKSETTEESMVGATAKLLPPTPEHRKQTASVPVLEGNTCVENENSRAMDKPMDSLCSEPTQTANVLPAADSIVYKRVQLLVARRAPLNLGSLINLYQRCFHEHLNHKSFGFRKLKQFVESIPFITMERTGNTWLLSSSLEDKALEEIMTEVGPIVESERESGKVYGCLGCGKRLKVWDDLFEHMQECCPTKLTIHKLKKNRWYKERQTCTIGHKRCVVPDTDSLEPEAGDDEEACLGCVCGEIHPETVLVYWIQCDMCRSWYNVAPICVGFTESQARSVGNWVCRGCSVSVGETTSVFTERPGKAFDRGGSLFATAQPKGPKMNTVTEIRNDRKRRNAEDGIFLPYGTPRKKDDGTYARPRGRGPPEMVLWDATRGLYTIPRTKSSGAKEIGPPKKVDDPIPPSADLGSCGSPIETQGVLPADPSTNVRRTEDGCFLPRRPPKQKEDGTYARPCGRAPPGMVWDSTRGVFAPKSNVTGMRQKSAPPKQVDAPSPLVEDKSSCESLVNTQVVLPADPSTNDRRTEDGCFLPLKKPKKKEDGTYARPCGRAPPGMVWDSTRGVFAPKSNVTGMRQKSAPPKTSESLDQAATASSDNGKQVQPSNGRDPPKNAEDRSPRDLPRSHTPSPLSTTIMSTNGKQTQPLSVGKKAAMAERGSREEREADRERRTTDDGCFVPKSSALKKKEDGTYARPRGRCPPGMVWDAHRGVFAPPKLPKTKSKPAFASPKDPETSTMTTKPIFDAGGIELAVTGTGITGVQNRDHSSDAADDLHSTSMGLSQAPSTLSGGKQSLSAGNQEPNNAADPHPRGDDKIASDDSHGQTRATLSTNMPMNGSQAQPLSGGKKASNRNGKTNRSERKRKGVEEEIAAAARRNKRSARLKTGGENGMTTRSDGAERKRRGTEEGNVVNKRRKGTVEDTSKSSATALDSNEKSTQSAASAASSTTASPSESASSSESASFLASFDTLEAKAKRKQSTKVGSRVYAEWPQNKKWYWATVTDITMNPSFSTIEQHSLRFEDGDFLDCTSISSFITEDEYVAADLAGKASPQVEEESRDSSDGSSTDEANNFLVGRKFCFAWTNLQGRQKEVYGVVTKCQENEDEVTTCEVKFTEESRAMVNAVDNDCGSVVPESQVLSCELAIGACMRYEEQNPGLEERLAAVYSDLPFYLQWTLPLFRHDELVEGPHGKLPRLTLSLRGFRLELNVKDSKIPGAGKGVFLTCVRVDGSKGGIFKLAAGELVDLGIYAPLLLRDRRSEASFDIKNFVHSNKCEVFGMDSNEPDYPFDITDDVTGELHVEAKSHIYAYVNESDDENLIAIHARHDPEGCVHYLLGHANESQGEFVMPCDGSEVEVYINYGPGYERVRVRKGYSFCSEQEKESILEELKDEDLSDIVNMNHFDTDEVQSAVTFMFGLFSTTDASEFTESVVERALTCAAVLRCRAQQLFLEASEDVGTDMTSSVKLNRDLQCLISLLLNMVSGDYGALKVLNGDSNVHGLLQEVLSRRYSADQLRKLRGMMGG